MRLMINKEKRIGHVLFIVEGQKTEPNILYYIFEKIFGYRYTRIYKDGKKPYDSLSSDKDKYSRVFVINAQESNISNIASTNLYLDSIFKSLIEDYDLDFENMAIFYIWDRDYHSNTNIELIEELLNSLGNSRDSFDYTRQGLLLLSYPAIEAYIASSFLNESFNIEFDVGSKLKRFLNEKKINPQNINEETLIYACKQLLEALKTIGILELDLDNMSSTNTIVFDFQEDNFHKKGEYRLLSMLSFALLDLGMISIL